MSIWQHCIAKSGNPVFRRGSKILPSDSASQKMGECKFWCLYHYFPRSNDFWESIWNSRTLWPLAFFILKSVYRTPKNKHFVGYYFSDWCRNVPYRLPASRGFDCRLVIYLVNYLTIQIMKKALLCCHQLG